MNGDYKLIKGIIESGIKDKDTEYFNSEIFEIHCHLLNIKDVAVIREKCLKAIEGSKK